MYKIFFNNILILIELYRIVYIFFDLVVGLGVRIKEMVRWEW